MTRRTHFVQSISLLVLHTSLHRRVERKSPDDYINKML